MEGSIPSSNRYDLNVSIKSMTEDQRLKTAEEYKSGQNSDQKVVSRRNIPAFRPLLQADQAIEMAGTSLIQPDNQSQSPYTGGEDHNSLDASPYLDGLSPTFIANKTNEGWYERSKHYGGKKKRVGATSMKIKQFKII